MQFPRHDFASQIRIPTGCKNETSGLETNFPNPKSKLRRPMNSMQLIDCEAHLLRRRKRKLQGTSNRAAAPEDISKGRLTDGYSS